MRLVIASRNAHKVDELKTLFAGTPIEPVSLDALDQTPALIETGSTFRANALQKAQTVARFCGELTLADDSGLEVEALAGDPGVYSARYAYVGTDYLGNAPDDANNRKLLRELEHVPLSQRRARYVCVLALVDLQSGNEWVFEGQCEGRIELAPKGAGGFGYDPLFYLPEKRCTMAEISLEEKNSFSHRARAMHALKLALPQILLTLKGDGPA